MNFTRSMLTSALVSCLISADPLPSTLGVMETILDATIHAKWQLGGKVCLAVEEIEASEVWRVRVHRVRGFAG